MRVGSSPVSRRAWILRGRARRSPSAAGRSALGSWFASGHWGGGWHLRSGWRHGRASRNFLAAVRCRVRSMETVVIAAWQGLSPKDWATTVQNIADYLPASVLASPQGQSLLLSGDDVHARVPRGCLSEMVSAAVIRFSSGARTALLQRLDRHHVSSVCRGHEPVCPPSKGTTRPPVQRLRTVGV